MRNHAEHVQNLQSLAEQEGSPVGYVSIDSVATMLELRDDLIRDLKRIIEEDTRWRLISRSSNSDLGTSDSKAALGYD